MDGVFWTCCIDSAASWLGGPTLLPFTRYSPGGTGLDRELGRSDFLLEQDRRRSSACFREGQDVPEGDGSLRRGSLDGMLQCVKAGPCTFHGVQNLPAKKVTQCH